MVDSGVIVSALLSPGGSPRKVVDHVLAGTVEMAVSPHLLAELLGVLHRPKFTGYPDEGRRREVLDALVEVCLLVADPEFEPGLTRDPGDDYLVALARESRADYLVSGDRDMLEMLDPHPPVVTPRQLLDILGAG